MIPFPKIMALTLALTVFSVVPAFSQEQASDLQNIIKKGVIRVGAPISDPWYIKDPGTQKWSGLVPDIFELMFGAINVKVEYVETEWGTAAAGLQADRFDVIGGFDATPPRVVVFDFTDPIMTIDTALLSLKGDVDKYRTWAAVNASGVTIAGVEGTSFVNMMQPKLPNVKWVLVPSYEAALLEVQSGRAELMLGSQIGEGKIIRAHNQGKLVVPTPVQGTPTSIGLRKSNPPELRYFMNEALTWFRPRGDIDNIIEKYAPSGK